MNTTEESVEPEKDSRIDSETIKHSSIRDVVYTLKPVIICEHVFGIFRFRLAENKLLPTRGRTKILGFVIVAIYVIPYAWTFKFPASKEVTNRTIAEFIDQVPAMIILIQYIASAVITMFFIGERTIKIITLFAELDCTLRIGLNENFYKNSSSKTTKCVLAVVLLHVLLSSTDILTDFGSVYYVLTYKILPLIFNIEQDIEIFVFCKMVYMLSSRLRIINDYLAKFVEEQETATSVFNVSKKDIEQEQMFNFIGRSSDTNKKIKELATLYDLIGELCAMINVIFNFQLFMNLVSTFTYIIITIWASLYYFKKPEDVDSKMIAVVLWCVLTVLSVAVMAFACEHLLTSRHDTRILVNEVIMNYDLPRSMRLQAKAFMGLIEAWPLRIFVYDMFSIDITLMLKFVSVATTYLIVAIQISHLI